MAVKKSKSRAKVPGYLLHKATGQARVVLNGRTHYLGIYGSPESHAHYAEIVKKWRDNDPEETTEKPLTVADAKSCLPVLLAALIIASTSSGVRYSRLRTSAFFGRRRLNSAFFDGWFRSGTWAVARMDTYLP